MDTAASRDSRMRDAVARLNMTDENRIARRHFVRLACDMTNAPAVGVFAPAYLGREEKSRCGKKGKKNTRFAVKSNKLLRGRLIRDLIICCEKTGRERARCASTSISKLEDKFTTAAHCSFSRQHRDRSFYKELHCKNNKFSLHMLLLFVCRYIFVKKEI